MNQFENTFTQGFQRATLDRLNLTRPVAQPIITEENAPRSVENPALAKIAKDVLDTAKLSFTAALEKPDGVLKGSAEGVLAQAYLAQAKQTGQASEIQKMATGLLDGDAKTMSAVFGRALTEPDGTTISAGSKVRDVLPRLDGGIERAVERMTFQIDPRHLGIRPPSLDIRLDTPGLRMDGGNLVVPGNVLGGGFESADDLESARETLVNSDAAGLQDGVLDRDLFATMWGASLNQDMEGADNDFEAVTDRLRLTLLRLHCVDETGSSGFFGTERWGDDEMAIGGVSVDEDGQSKSISERFIGSGFRDGRSRTMNWPYQVFNLNEGSGFPKSYGVTFLLAEKDNGGLSSAIQSVWAAVRNAVRMAISKAATAAGVAIGTFLAMPQAGAIIGQAIAAAVNWILDALIGWIVSAFKDDIFSPQTTRMRIPSLTARWRHANGQWGATQSPVLRRRFSGHNGVYDLYYRWSLST